MRSSSRRPCGSNKQSSTRSPCPENSAKLVPRPFQLAPSGCDAPGSPRISILRHEKQRAERRQSEAQFRASAPIDRPDRSGIAHVAAAIDRRIAVEDFMPSTGAWNPDAIAAAYFGGKIDHDDAKRLLIA